MNIEQIAQEVDNELCVAGIDIEANEFPAEFLRRCLSKLAEQAVEPVAYAWDSESAGLTYENHYSDTTPLYTEAQLAASQLREQQLREAATMAEEMIATNAHERRHVRWKLQDALALPADTSALDQIKADYEMQIQQLREAMQQEINYHFMQAGPKDLPNIKKALALPQDTSALDKLKAGYEAQIQQLRDALKEIKGSGYTNLSPRCHMLMGAALSETQDTAAIDRIKAVYEAHQNKMQDEIEALRKEVGRLLATGIGQIMSDAAAKAGEVMRERCLDKTPDPHDRNRIRALPGVTMEDIK